MIGTGPWLEGATVCDKSVAPRAGLDAEAWCERAPARTAGHAVAYRFAVRRRLLIIAIFLLAGAVVNVTVAWGIVLRSSVPPVGRPFERVSGVSAWPRPVPDDWPLPEAQKSARSWGLSELKTLANVAPMSPLPLKGTWVAVGMTLFRAGWPCRSLEADFQGRAIYDLPLQIEWRYSLTLPEPLTIIRREEARYRPLPYRPLWLGLAANTVFYAAVIWLLISGPFVLRRIIRVKRGRCVKCGYPVSESAVCSECGKALPGRAEAAT